MSQEYMALQEEDGSLVIRFAVPKMTFSGGEDIVDFTLPAEEASKYAKFRIVTDRVGGPGVSLLVKLQGGHEDIVPGSPHAKWVTDKEWRLWPRSN